MDYKTFPDLTRREFMQIGAGVAALVASGKSLGDVPAPARAFEHGNPLKEFGYGDAHFVPGPHQAQLEQTHAILMGLDEEGLLRPFRMAAGLAAPGWDLGGWYSAIPRSVSGGPPGPEADGPTGPETFGQWVSALSRYFAATGDKATQLKVQRLIEGYAAAWEPTGKIYRFSMSPTYFYDKLICGLEDAYEFAGVKEALALISKATDAAQSFLPGKAIDQLSREGKAGGPANDTFEAPENLFIAWQRSGDDRYLAMARAYLADDFYFDPLARGENILATRHAYSSVNALCSAAKAYLVLGDEKHLRAAINGLSFVEQQSFATGGWGPSESFLPRPAEDYKDPNTGEIKHYPAIESLADSIAHESYHFETPCGSYAHFKLTRYLLRITKDPRYGDSMERVMYNTVLGALPLNKFGNAFYQSNYHGHAQKAYFDGYGNVMKDEWPCCSGTLPQVAADYHISTYFRDGEGVFINLYIPSTLRWDQQGHEITLTQSGTYPLADDIVFDIKASGPTRFTVRLRIPAWTKSPGITINGTPIATPVRAGAFATLHREWKSGDRVELHLPKQLELKPVDAHHPDLVALTYGPLVLFALSDDTPKITRAELLSAKRLPGGSAEWQASTSAGPLRFAPFWTIKDETYFTYLSV